MKSIPRGFAETLAGIHRDIQGVAGAMTDREVDFLALLAACPLAAGEILEIGSYRGRSAIILARAAALSGNGSLVAVDPVPGGRDELNDNLRRARVDRQ